MIGVVSEASRDTRRKIRPYFLTSDGKPKSIKFIYDFAGFLVTHMFVFPYFGASFGLLGYEHSMEVYLGFYFIPHVLAILIFVIVRFMVPSPKKRKD